MRDDFEYVRRGTCNLFGCFEPHAGRRQIVVTNRRTKQDFAAMMRTLVDEPSTHESAAVLTRGISTEKDE